MENTLTTLVRKLIPDGGFMMVWSIIGILLAVYLLLCFLAWLSDKQRDIIAKYYRPKKVLDATEEKFFKLLRAAVPADCKRCLFDARADCDEPLGFLGAVQFETCGFCDLQRRLEYCLRG